MKTKMTMNNWLSHRIRLLSNRVRCSKCHADSSEAVFVVGETIKFTIPIEQMARMKEDYSANFKNRMGKMSINKFYEIVSVNSLTRVCTRCGQSRKTVIPRGLL